MVDLAFAAELMRREPVSGSGTVARCARWGLVAAGITVAAFLAGRGLTPEARAVARITVADPAADVALRDAQVAAAAQLIQSTEFLRVAARALDDGRAEALTRSLVPAAPGSRIVAALGLPGPAATAEDARVGRLAAAMSVSRYGADSLAVALDADDASDAVRAANAVADSYVTMTGDVTGGPKAHVALRAEPVRARDNLMIGLFALAAGLAAAGLGLGLELWALYRRVTAHFVPEAPSIVDAVPVDIRLPAAGAATPASRRSAAAIWASRPEEGGSIAVVATGSAVGSGAVARLLAGAGDAAPAVLVDLSAETTATPKSPFGALAAGDASFAEAIIRTGNGRSYLLRGCRADLGAGAERIQAVVEALVHAYDRVVVHLAPQDAAVLADRPWKGIGAVLLVTDRDACAPGVRAAHERLTRFAGAEVIVAALEGPVAERPASSTPHALKAA